MAKECRLALACNVFVGEIVDHEALNVLARLGNLAYQSAHDVYELTCPENGCQKGAIVVLGDPFEGVS